MLWKGKRMTLMASVLSAFSFYENHELNIAQKHSGRTGYGAAPETILAETSILT